MIKLRPFITLSLCLFVILSLISCTSKDNSIYEIDFSKKELSDGYTEYLYLNNILYGISSEVGDVEIFEGVGKKIGEINNIGNTVVTEGDVGVKDTNKEFLFKTGDEIYQVKGTSDRLIVLIKTSEGYLHAKSRR